MRPGIHDERHERLSYGFFKRDRRIPGQDKGDPQAYVNYLMQVLHYTQDEAEQILATRIARLLKEGPTK